MNEEVKKLYTEGYKEILDKEIDLINMNHNEIKLRERDIQLIGEYLS